MLIDDFRPSDQPDKSDESLKKNAENFQTPEEVAAIDTIERPATLPIESTTEDTPDINTNYTKPKTPRHQGSKFALHWPLGKKEWGIICLLIILAGVGITVALSHHTPKPVAVVKQARIVAAAPTTVASPLSGVQVAPALAHLPVTGVMIENSDAARPQSGMSQAGVIFEALAEGGVTRFLVLYQEGQPSSIGPVRSARPYFIDWLLPFDAAYAHVGGSPTALSDIQSLGVRDMNQFYNGNYYTRISSRQAPHNAYTSMTSLHSLEQAKGWTSSTFTSFPRKADAPSKTPTATSINFSLSGPDMAAHYQYDPKLNSYARSEGGAPMLDANTNQQLEPKVVIAMVVPWTNGPLDSSGAHYTQYSDIGSGTAYIFQDGIVTPGVWAKSSSTSQLQFNTASGLPIKLNAGQTWITAVGSVSGVNYGT